MRSIRLLTLSLALGLLAGCAGSSAPVPAAASYRGVQPAPIPSRPSYVLTDTDGKRFDFAAETRGKPTYVYFGYTNCPDECPTAMADIAAALRTTSAKARAGVRVIFVSTDAKRDTAPVMRRFLDQFSTTFIGLLGTQAELDAAARASGVPPGQVGPAPSTLPGRADDHVHKDGTAPHEHFGPLGYSVEHSAVIFAYDAADRLPVVYPGGVTPSDIAADLPLLADPPRTP
ncbi:MAG: SCO family protein [Mycobacteriales bacterium]